MLAGVSLSSGHSSHTRRMLLSSSAPPAEREERRHRSRERGGAPRPHETPSSASRAGLPSFQEALAILEQAHRHELTLCSSSGGVVTQVSDKAAKPPEAESGRSPSTSPKFHIPETGQALCEPPPITPPGLVPVDPLGLPFQPNGLEKQVAEPLSADASSPKGKGDLSRKDTAATCVSEAVPKTSSANKKMGKGVRHQLKDLPGGVDWRWEHRTGMKPYDPEVQQRIEFAFQSGESKVRLKAGLAGKRGSATPMEVFFFGGMMQCDPRSGNTRKVQRFGPDSFMDRSLRLCKHAWICWRTGQTFRETCDQYRQRRKQMEGTHNDEEPGARPSVSAMGSVRHMDSQSWCGQIVTTWAFNVFINLVVLFSSIWVAVETDNNEAEVITEAPPLYQVAAQTLTVIFLVEALLRWGAFDSTKEALRNFWLRFDLILLILMIVENWIFPLVLFIMQNSTEGYTIGNNSLLKTARLLKVARMVRLVRMIPEVMTLVRGMLQAIKSVLVTILILFMLNIFFGIAMRIQFVGSVGEAKEVEQQYFPSVLLSMWTLMFQGTLLDSVNLVASACRDAGKDICVLIFFVYIFLSTFTVLNILIGIVCEVISKVKSDEERWKMQHKLEQDLTCLLEVFDTDDSKSLGKDEFALLIKNPELHQVLQKFGTSPQDLKHLAGIEYEDRKSLDEEQQDLSFDEIMDIVVRLQGEGVARLHDIVELRTYTRNRLDALNDAVLENVNQLKEGVKKR